MNVILLLVDSLRFDAAYRADLPFFRRLDQETISFSRAYAPECWTLPTHASMFTGLLPSQHGAHFQTMGYAGSAPTIAELLAARGFTCEVVTRNSIFDGSLPGITRGFRRNVRLLCERPLLDPLSLMLAASKPRFRTQIRTTGFFHPAQRQNRAFIAQFARATLPADRRTLEYVVTRADALRRARQPFFLFANLYDVHAPYAPRETSVLESFGSVRGINRNLRMPFVLPALGGHRYLHPGFRLSAASRRMLRERYGQAVALMDRKLAAFYAASQDAGILEDTLLIVTSDHGEAFGEHGLYLHDASVYDTHLHVPLWIRHPTQPHEAVDDIVSTRDLFGLVRSAALNQSDAVTILDPAYRREHPVALAEHFYYPHCPTMAAKYRVNQRAVITDEGKFVVRGSARPVASDRATDPGEDAPIEVDAEYVERALRRSDLSRTLANTARDHLLNQSAA